MEWTFGLFVTFISPIIVFGANYITHRFKKHLAWVRVRDDPRLYEGVNLTQLIDTNGVAIMKKCQIVEMKPGRIEVQSLDSRRPELMTFTVLEFEKMHPVIENTRV